MCEYFIGDSVRHDGKVFKDKWERSLFTGLSFHQLYLSSPLFQRLVFSLLGAIVPPDFQCGGGHGHRVFVVVVFLAGGGSWEFDGVISNAPGHSVGSYSHAELPLVIIKIHVKI